MDRIDVIQKLIDYKKARTYLEIGVAKGLCFFKIKARRKIAVDPSFIFSKKRKWRSCFSNPCNFSNRYFEMTSDSFFDNHIELLTEASPEIVFLDGLHTHEQSFRDFRNALQVMTPEGIIVLHDCNPSSAPAATPALSYEHARELRPDCWTGEWSGDVWKTIPKIRKTFPDLTVFVLDCDYGLGIITKRSKITPRSISISSIDNLSYKDLERDREAILNLKRPEYFEEFLRSI